MSLRKPKVKEYTMPLSHDTDKFYISQYAYVKGGTIIGRCLFCGRFVSLEPMTYKGKTKLKDSVHIYEEHPGLAALLLLRGFKLD